MIKVKKKKDKVKRKRVGNVRTTEKTRKKGGNVSQVVNVYVTKGGGGRRKAPAPSRPSFMQTQPQLFTANYDNALLNQIQPIQDKFIKVINTNNDLLNKLLIKQRTADSSIQTDTLTNDKLFTKETQTAPEKIPSFRPADTQTEPILNRVIETQTEPIFQTTTDTQTTPTFFTTTDTQTPPLQNVISTQTTPFLTTQGTQSDAPLFQPVDTQSDTSSFIDTDRQVTSDMELQEYLNYLTSVDKDKPELDEAIDEALQTQITIAINDLEDIEKRVLELGGEKIKGKKPKKIKAINKAIKQYQEQEKRLLLQQRRDDEELSDLINKDIQEQRQSEPAEQDDLTTQLIDIKNRAKANKIPLKRGGIPSTDEGKRNQIRYYSEQIALKNRATSI